MATQSRSTEPLVSLPSIHELFPEHLMNVLSTPGPSRRGNQRHPTTAAPRRPQAAQSFNAPPNEYARGPSETSYRYTSRYPNDNGPHPQHATQTHRPLGIPHTPAAGPSVFPSAPTSSSMPPTHDSNRRNRQGHPVVSIPSSHPERSPNGQDSNTLPDAQPTSYSGSSLPVDDLGDLTDDETASTGTPAGIPRKHICLICHKAFNRPSSLKIHFNTHTGATPFRCPWPKCGREFNVNSNMRRHYRNHTTNTNQETPEDGPRRRRRRSSTSSTNPPPVIQQSVGETRALPPNSAARHQGPPSQVDPSAHPSNVSHQYSRYRVYDYGNKDHHGMELDEAEEYHVSEDPHYASRLPVPVMRASQTLAEPRGTTHPNARYHGAPVSQQPQAHAFNHHHSHSSSYSSMRVRALTPGSSFHSSSPSPSPSPSLSSSASPSSSPPPSTLTSPIRSPAMLPHTHAGQQQQYQYSPSMPYLRHAGDPHVSTALRPAFNTGSNAVAPRR